MDSEIGIFRTFALQLDRLFSTLERAGKWVLKMDNNVQTHMNKAPSKGYDASVFLPNSGKLPSVVFPIQAPSHALEPIFEASLHLRHSLGLLGQ